MAPGRSASSPPASEASFHSTASASTTPQSDCNSQTTTPKEALSASITGILARFKSRGKNSATLDQTTEALICLFEEFAIQGDGYLAVDARTPAHSRVSSTSKRSGSVASVSSSGVTTPVGSNASSNCSWIDVLDFAFVQDFRPSPEAVKAGGQKAYNEFRQLVNSRLEADGTILSAPAKKQVISDAYKAWKDCQDDGPGAVPSWGSEKKKEQPQQVELSSRSASLAAVDPDIEIKHPNLHNPIAQDLLQFHSLFTSGGTINEQLAAARHGPRAHIETNIGNSVPPASPPAAAAAAAAATTPTPRQTRSMGSAGTSTASLLGNKGFEPRMGSRNAGAWLLNWPKFRARKRDELVRMNPGMTKDEISSAISRAWEQYKADNNV